MRVWEAGKTAERHGGWKELEAAHLGWGLGARAGMAGSQLSAEGSERQVWTWWVTIALKNAVSSVPLGLWREGL